MKLFNKKGLTVSLLAILSCGLLVGCRDDKRILSDKGYIRAFTDIELRTTAGADTIKVLQNLANRFTEEVEPNVTITVNKYSGDYSGLANDVRNGFSAGTHPDMTMVYPDAVADFIDDGFAYNLEPYMYNEEYGWSEEDFDDLITTYLEEGQNYVVEGTYSLPFSKSTEVMYYNQRILNLSIPNVATTDDPNDTIVITPTYLETLTWETFFGELCPSIMAYTETPAGENLINKGGTAGEEWAILGYDSDDNLFITLAQQYGYDYTALDQNTGYAEVLFNNDGMKGLMKKFNSYYHDGYLITKGTSEGGYTNSFFTKRNTLFSVGSTGGYKYQTDGADFNVGVANIPHAEGKERYVINQGPSISILKSTASDANNRALASWLFYKFLTNTTNSTYWATETGYMPVRYSVYETEAFMDYANTDGKPQMSTELLGAKTARFSQVVSSSDELFFSPVFKGSSEARQQVGSIMTQSLLQPEADFTDTWLNGIFEKAVNETLLAMS